jgi:uncharacterized protein YjbI with pentapeptide repeats
MARLRVTPRINISIPGLSVDVELARSGERETASQVSEAVAQLSDREHHLVRANGLVELERIAQGNRAYRQRVVNHVCDYLCTPFNPVPPGPETYEVWRLERGIRIKAQEFLSSHLRRRGGKRFWKDIDLHLSGAALIDFSLDCCTLRNADFRRAVFTGGADFTEVVIGGSAEFSQAQFTGWTRFSNAEFGPRTDFTGSAFASCHLLFLGATFNGNVFFDEAVFQDGSYPPHEVDFRHAVCRGEAFFANAMFQGLVDFSHATFSDASFSAVKFLDGKWPAEVRFWHTTFGRAFFSRLRFPAVSFHSAVFDDAVQFEDSVTFLNDPLPCFEKAYVAYDITGRKHKPPRGLALFRVPYSDGYVLDRDIGRRSPNVT